jgi:hypothetical protein
MATSAESRGEHATLYPELRQAGVTLMRAWPEWGRIQPGRGQWNWAECDALLQSARGNQIELIGGLWYLTNWASTNGPDYPDGNFGLLRRDWSKRPSYYALRTMTDLLEAIPLMPDG